MLIFLRYLDHAALMCRRRCNNRTCSAGASVAATACAHMLRVPLQHHDRGGCACAAPPAGPQRLARLARLEQTGRAATERHQPHGVGVPECQLGAAFLERCAGGLRAYTAVSPLPPHIAVCSLALAGEVDEVRFCL